MCVDGFWGKGEQFGARAEEENVAVAGDRCLGIGRGLDERKEGGREGRKKVTLGEVAEFRTQSSCCYY